MNRQAINLLGGVVVALIVVVGVLAGVLPRWQSANATHQEQQMVLLRNQDQQDVIAALQQERQNLPELQAQGAALQQEIPAGPRLDQVIALASNLPGGAKLRSLSPGDAAADGSTGFETMPVTLSIAVDSPTNAAATLDKLRSGPRLLAIDRATFAPGSPATLTVVGRVFLTPEGSS